MFLTVIQIVLTLVGPIIAALIKEWLLKAEAAMREPAVGSNPRDNVKDLFDAALAQVPWYRFRVKSALRAVRKASLEHADKIMQAARAGENSIRLSDDEYEMFGKIVSEGI